LAVDVACRTRRVRALGTVRSVSADIPPFVIAHLSDLHLGRPGTVMDELLDPVGRLERVVDRLEQLGDGVDAVLITGDLVDEGTVEEYRRLSAVLQRIEAPLVLLAGNHDDPSAMAEVFAELPHRPRGGVDADEPVGAGFTVEDWPLRIVAIDSTVPGLHSGELGDARLAHLDRELSARPDRPTLVVLHHPPIEVGMWWMDYGAPPGSAALAEVIERHPQVAGVAAGHIHRSTQCAWAGTLLHVAGSVAYQSRPALVADPEPLVDDDEAELGLLRWDGTRLVAHQVATGTERRTLDLRELIRPWEPYERAARDGGPMRK
jgi:3',5'-cyclic AMP phosphodiesterase CpdA